MQNNHTVKMAAIAFGIPFGAMLVGDLIIGLSIKLSCVGRDGTCGVGGAMEYFFVILPILGIVGVIIGLKVVFALYAKWMGKRDAVVPSATKVACIVCAFLSLVVHLATFIFIWPSLVS